MFKCSFSNFRDSKLVENFERSETICFRDRHRRKNALRSCVRGSGVPFSLCGFGLFVVLGLCLLYFFAKQDAADAKLR